MNKLIDVVIYSPLIKIVVCCSKPGFKMLVFKASRQALPIWTIASEQYSYLALPPKLHTHTFALC